MVVAFRADSSSQIGSGHVMRCLALAHGLKEKGARCLFISKNYPGNLIDHVRDEGFEAEVLAREVNLCQDKQQTAEICLQEAVDVLVTDSYGLCEDYLTALKKEVPLLVSIDDLAKIRFCSDILLNQNLSASIEDYRNLIHPKTKLLLGPQYALLREEFIKQREKERIIADYPHRLLITFGGSDPANQTIKVLRAVTGFDLEVTVIIGSGYKHYDELIHFTENHKGPAQIFIKRNVREISRLMLEADLAVSAGGSTCWELACLGLPNMILVLAENQIPIARILDEKGVSVNLGWFEKVKEVDISKCLSWLMGDVEKRKRMSQKGRQLVDGKGVQRVVEEINTRLKR